MSDPAASATAATVPATTSGTSGTTVPASTTPGDSGGHSGTLPPAKVNVYPLTFNSDSGWPPGLKLDSRKDNWQEWNKQLRFLCDQHGFRPYLNGTLARPDQTLHFESACAWETSDVALRGFICQHISDHDYDVVGELPTAFEMYDALRNKYQKLGPYAKIKTIRAILDTVTPLHGTPYCQTFDEIAKLQSRYIKMGHLTDDQLLCIYMLNALRLHPRMQTSLNDMLANPLTTSADIRRRLEQEDDTIGTGTNPPENALAAAAGSTKPPRPVCANCEKVGHRTEFCIAAGGQMAGKTIEEARAARDAARNKTRGTDKCTGRNTANASNTANSANTATVPITNNQHTITINGQQYMLVNQANSNVVPETNSALSAISMPAYDEQEYMAVIATTDEPRASLDWTSHVRLTSSECALTANAKTDELPFILDSGATCHISPLTSDFKVLRSIPRRPVKGLCGTAIHAIGMGDIELRIAGGHVLKLTDVLYIPESSVRLISILALNRSGSYTTHFDSNGCWVTNKSNTTLVRGSLSGKRLYVLTTKTPAPRTKAPDTQSALFARVPDVETWHRRLGHCNTRAIVEMAKNGVSQGMPIDLSSLPPKCDHCAIGKQTHSPVPKIREGKKATERLGRVYVDLCGQMAVMSRSRKLYCMNIIDDFSGYVWSIPLHSKSDAFPAFQIWHKAVMVQTGDTLRIIVSDNGELVSKAMADWCQSLGIDHQRTAPYTSTQNGRVERLHRTIQGKARAMRISCNAPGNLWDEFFLTAAYLTNLTAATANNGRTPYELWFGKLPSLSHLREIGCRAFALHTPSPSKIYARSGPCILIGYSPHSKAYRLWDPASSRIFDSFHVSFTEHLDASPSPFHPGTVLGTTTASCPPSWDVSGPAPPDPPEPNHRTPFYDYDYASLFPYVTNHPPFTIVSNPNADKQTENKEQQNNVPTENNTVTTSNNTVNSSRNTVTPSSNTANTSRNTVTPSSPTETSRNTVNPTDDTSRNTVNPTNNTTNNTVTPSNTTNENTRTIPNDTTNPRLTIRIPPRTIPPPLSSPPASPPASRRSARLQGLEAEFPGLALLAEYASVRDTHDLFPTDIIPTDSVFSIDDILSALSDGSLQPTSANEDDEPTWSQAMASDEREYWIAGGREELKSLEDLKVFVLVPRTDVPHGQRPLKGKLVCKRKRDDTGKVVRYKVRYVAKGFAQRYGIDYDKTTAPTVRLESFRTILHLAATLNWDLKQFDIKTAFLHGILPEDETMYMEQPPGFASPGKEEWVMRLMKSIYGMKQASRIWNQTFHNAVVQWGFERLDCEWCVYRRNSPTGTIIFAVHVDDIIAAGSSPKETEQFRDLLKSKWEITELGEPKHALGIAISRNHENHTISLSQAAKIDQLVNEYGQQDAHSVDTPMVPGAHL